MQKEYKANRKVNPEFPRMQKQLAVLEPLLEALGFHTIKISGVECDDLMGILAKGLVEKNCKVRLHSMDSDLYQLLTMKGVEVWENWDKNFITAADVERKEGVAPRDWVKVEAMAGGHNNLKGLWKVGPIKARDLFAAGASPDKNWFKQPMMIQTLLAKYRNDWARIQQEYRMATIVTDIESEVWTEKQQTELKKVLDLVVEYPERRWQHSEKMEKTLYHFLGRYELSELFEERATFWKIK